VLKTGFTRRHIGTKAAKEADWSKNRKIQRRRQDFDGKGKQNTGSKGAREA